VSPTAPFLAPERDERFKLGRAKQGSTAYYTIPGWGGSTPGTAGAPAINTDTYKPFVVQSPLVVDQMAFEVTTLQSGNARVGIYRADANLQPVGGPLADSGDISTNTTGVKTYTPGTPIYLARGRYLTVFNVSVAGVLCRSFRGIISDQAADSILGASLIVDNMTVGRSYAAFPTPGTAWTAITGSATATIMWVFLRVLTP
jgi:hypothetical protein